jgi:dephospho-CoA kinase
MTALRVGLTGGIGSGKTAVSDRLGQLGAVVIDADLLAREVVGAGTPGLAEVVVAFGPDVLTDDGELNRAAIGARVFGDEEARRRLEAIIHPRVRSLAAEIEAAAPEDAVVVHVIPLLVETGQGAAFDQIVVVDVPPDVQLDRLVQARGMTPGDVRARLAAQASREERLAAADHVVVNDGTMQDLHDAVDALWTQLESLATKV